MYYLNNNIGEFIKYTNKTENIDEIMNLADFELSSKLDDGEVIDIILKIYMKDRLRMIV